MHWKIGVVWTFRPTTSYFNRFPIPLEEGGKNSSFACVWFGAPGIWQWAVVRFDPNNALVFCIKNLLHARVLYAVEGVCSRFWLLRKRGHFTDRPELEFMCPRGCSAHFLPKHTIPHQHVHIPAHLHSRAWRTMAPWLDDAPIHFVDSFCWKEGREKIGCPLRGSIAQRRLFVRRSRVDVRVLCIPPVFMHCYSNRKCFQDSCPKTMLWVAKRMSTTKSTFALAREPGSHRPNLPWWTSRIRWTRRWIQPRHLRKSLCAAMLSTIDLYQHPPRCLAHRSDNFLKWLIKPSRPRTLQHQQRRSIASHSTYVKQLNG